MLRAGVRERRVPARAEGGTRPPREKIRSPGAIQADCHRITHAIGSGALAHFDGDTGAAFAAGGVTCASGYYHGIIERSLLGRPTEAIGPLTQSLCASPTIRHTDFIHFQCVHGLGHGLMIYTGYGLPRSLDYCDELETESERESCRGGVFMENSQSSYGVRSKWLKDDDLIYPCNAVVQRAKYECYLIQLARIGPALGFDWQRIAATCRESEPEFVVVCFQSIGREASGATQHSAAGILEICRFGGDMEDECIYGAARDLTYNDAGPKRAKLFCNSAPRRHRGYCWEGIGTLIGNFYPEENPEARRMPQGNDDLLPRLHQGRERTAGVGVRKATSLPPGTIASSLPRGYLRWSSLPARSQRSRLMKHEGRARHESRSPFRRTMSPTWSSWANMRMRSSHIEGKPQT